MPAGTGRRAVGKRRDRASDAPPVQCTMPGPEATHTSKGAGSVHANRCAGPYASALLNMPQLPPTSGAARAKAGLADVPLDYTLLRVLKSERAARCLTAILPPAAAEFVLHTPAAELAAEGHSATAEHPAAPPESTSFMISAEWLGGRDRSCTIIAVVVS